MIKVQGQKNENLPVVLVLKEIISRQKEYLIREKNPFVVEGRQICPQVRLRKTWN
mgnify:CR=1 FL=1